MKKTVLILTAIALTVSFASFSQNKATIPTDFSKGNIITNNNESLDGYIKELFKTQGNIQFINNEGVKKTFTADALQSFTTNNTVYITYLSDFYKTIVSGSKGNLFQKVTDNNGKLITVGTESVVASTTDGKIGDYYFQLKKDGDLILVTKQNFETVFSENLSTNNAVLAAIKSKQLNYSQITETVEKLNNSSN